MRAFRHFSYVKSFTDSISVHYDKIQNKIIGDGIVEMSDVKFTPIAKKLLRTSKDDVPLKLRELQFVSFTEPRCQVFNWIEHSLSYGISLYTL